MRKQLMKSGRAFVLIAMVMNAEWAKAEGDTESFNQFGSQFGGTSGLTPQGPQAVGTFQAAFEVRTNTNGDPRGKQVKQDCAVCHKLSVLINGREYGDGEAVTLPKGETHTVKVKDTPVPRDTPPGGDSSPPHTSNQKFTVWPQAVDGQTITSIQGNGPADSPQVFIAKKAEILQYLLDNSEGLMAQDKDWPENPADEPMNKTARLLPVEIKVSSAKPPAGTSGAKYTSPDRPTKGSADNLFSVWPGEDFTVKVKLPESFQLPPGLIKWTVAGGSIPDNTKEHTFNWSTTGTKHVEIKVGQSKFSVWVDLPDVGSLSQGDALFAVDPISSASLALYGVIALTHANQTWPAAVPKKDAIRHSYWMAMCASDMLVSNSAVLLVSTAHEHNNKFGVPNFFWQTGAPQDAFNSTMDLRNNLIGLSTEHFTALGTPDYTAILQDLDNFYQQGLMWIYDGSTSETASEGVLKKSNQQKIYTP